MFGKKLWVYIILCIHVNTGFKNYNKTTKISPIYSCSPNYLAGRQI